MKQLAVRNIDHPDEAWDDVEIPEEVGIDFHVSEKLGYQVTPKGNPVVGALGGEVSQIDLCLNNFWMGNAITLNEETGKL